MRSHSLFRRFLVLGLASSGLLTLTGCSDPMNASPSDSPEKVAATFVYYIGENKPEDARSLVYSPEEKLTTLEYGNIEQLRQRAGMGAGCVLGDSWGSRVSVVEASDSFKVTVPLRCGSEDGTTTLTITKTGNKWGNHRVVVD